MSAVSSVVTTDTGLISADPLPLRVIQGFKGLHISGHFNQAINMSPCFVLVSVLNASVNIYLL